MTWYIVACKKAGYKMSNVQCPMNKINNAGYYKSQGSENNKSRLSDYRNFYCILHVNRFFSRALSYFNQIFESNFSKTTRPKLKVKYFLIKRGLPFATYIHFRFR